MSGLSWAQNPVSHRRTELMDLAVIEEIRGFHRGFSQYAETPLHSLPHLAAELGVGGIYVKDESYRFGLNSFKALGSTYAVASYTRKSPGDYTFFATTDGNHGKAVAWAARNLGHKAIIYMPKGSPEVKLENIRAVGGEAHLSDLNYDDTIRMTAALADKTENGVIIQDTAWEGYEEIPSWIMQGYGVMALEAAEQLNKLNIKPTHMILQAGTGAFAGAVQAFAANYYGTDYPVTFIVEPTAADCHFRSAKAGRIVNVGGDMATIMAGLACGEPNTISWDILKNLSSFFISMEDALAARAVRVLGAPLRSDPRVISGESGASGMGFLLEMLMSGEQKKLREAAGIGTESHILVYSTEGDTDPANYRRIVWEGSTGR